MRPTSIPPASSSRRQPLSRRANALLLAVLAHVLILAILLWVSPVLPDKRKPAPPPVSFTMTPEPKPVPTPAPHTRLIASVKRPSGGAPRHPAPRPAPPTSKTDQPATGPMQMLVLDKGTFQTADIAGIPSQHGSPAPAGGGEGGQGSGTAEGDSEGAGTGPGGEKLYKAEWYREPTHAELVTYLPPRPTTGWGVIACRTIDRYHVDSCRELGESPGSGLSRTLRQAAFQFLIRPPRVGGHPLVGAWVSIRFDFTQHLVR